MVSSYVQLLARRYKGKLDERRATSSSATRWTASNRMQPLIDDLLDYSRVGRRGGDRAGRRSARSLERALANLAAAIEEARRRGHRAIRCRR